MKILIHPFSAKLRSGNPNPKNYPVERCRQIISHFTLQGDQVLQVGVDGEERLVGDCRFDLPLREIEVLLKESDCFIAVDSFLPHLAHLIGVTSGIVLWGTSDPLIFGHAEHVHLLKSRDNLRQFQFQHWEEERYLASVFVQPETVINAVEKFRRAPSTMLLTAPLYDAVKS